MYAGMRIDDTTGDGWLVVVDDETYAFSIVPLPALAVTALIELLPSGAFNRDVTVGVWKS